MDINIKTKEESSRKQFNFREVRHLAVNFAITCGDGYTGSFDDWFHKASPTWRKIANRK